MKEETKHNWPSAACVLITRQHSVLGVERGEYSFGLPAGNIEPCEPVAEAASRELLEETGLHVNADELIEILDAIEPTTGRRVVTYYANDPGGALAPQDQNIRAALWLGWPTLLEGRSASFAKYNAMVRSEWINRIPAAWIMENGSGSLRRAMEEGMRWNEMYLKERCAAEFGYGFEAWSDSRVTAGAAIAESDSSTTTETCWWARVLRSRFPDNMYQVIHATVSDDTGTRAGLAIECIPLLKPIWLPKGRRLIAFTTDSKGSVNPC